jgi:hypothetical protein
LRDGKDEVVWMHDLDEPPAASVVTTVPILPPDGPRPPEIGMVSDDRAADDGIQEEQ